jgi:UDP-N-acetylmuramoyl-tripeptide--D-alanyl-D-alanine ligase
MRWTIDQIVQATGGSVLYGDPESGFAGVGIDSRTIAADQIFVAIRGAIHDGHQFVDQVVAKGVRGIVIESGTQVPLAHEAFKGRGASCVVVSDGVRALGMLARHQRDGFDIPVVAITGSNGKTSTRLMTAAVMAQRFNTLSTQGNLNNEIGLPLTLFNLEAGHAAAVLELGMNHAGELTRLGAICRPTIGVLTNVGPAHLEFLGSLEGVARAKAELIDQVTGDGTVVLNADDVLVAAMARGAGQRRVIFFGTGENAQVRASDIRPHASGVQFDLILPVGRTPVGLCTPGPFMVFNALAAAAAGYAAGLSILEIKCGLEKFSQINGRLQVVEAGRGVRIIDDTYNANPASMAAAVDTLRLLKGPLPGIAIVGDMLELGGQAPVLHRQLGERMAASRVSRLYACGRYADDVAEGARQAGLAETAIFTGDKDAVTQDLLGRLESDCWLLVKGSRGMAMETVVAAVRHWAGQPVASHNHTEPIH